MGELSATGIKVPINYLQSQERDSLYVSFHGYIWPLEVPPVKGMSDLTMYLESINAYTFMFLSNDSSIQNAVSRIHVYMYLCFCYFNILA